LRARRDALVANFAVDKAALRLALAAAVDPGAVNFEARATLTARNTSAGNGRGLWVWRPTFLGKPAETQAFLDDLRLGREPDPGLAEGIRTLEIVARVYAASGYPRPAAASS
jgi:hypothetical protein